MGSPCKVTFKGTFSYPHMPKVTKVGLVSHPQYGADSGVPRHLPNSAMFAVVTKSPLPDFSREAIAWACPGA